MRRTKEHKKGATEVAKEQKLKHIKQIIEKMPAAFELALRDHLARDDGWEPVIRVPGRLEFYLPLLYLRHRQTLEKSFVAFYPGGEAGQLLPVYEDIIQIIITGLIVNNLYLSDLVTFTNSATVIHDAHGDEVEEDWAINVLATHRNDDPLNRRRELFFYETDLYDLTDDIQEKRVAADLSLGSVNGVLLFGRDRKERSMIQVVSVSGCNEHALILASGHNRLVAFNMRDLPSTYSMTGIDNKNPGQPQHVTLYYDSNDDQLKLLTEMPERIVATFCGPVHSFFLTEKGSLFAAGINSRNQMGLVADAEKQRELHRRVSGLDLEANDDQVLFFTRVGFAKESGRMGVPDIAFVATSYDCTVLISTENKLYVAGHLGELDVESKYENESSLFRPMVIDELSERERVVDVVISRFYDEPCFFIGVVVIENDASKRKVYKPGPFRIIRATRLDANGVIHARIFSRGDDDVSEDDTSKDDDTYDADETKGDASLRMIDESVLATVISDEFISDNLQYEEIRTISRPGTLCSSGYDEEQEKMDINYSYSENGKRLYFMRDAITLRDWWPIVQAEDDELQYLLVGRDDSTLELYPLGLGETYARRLPTGRIDLSSIDRRFGNTYRPMQLMPPRREPGRDEWTFGCAICGRATTLFSRDMERFACSTSCHDATSKIRQLLSKACQI